MLLKLSLGDTRPLHEQVAGAIRRAVAEGECAPGDKLPPARELARALGVNTNTVLRGLRTLRDEGVLEFRRGRGITIAGGADERAELVARVRQLVADAAKAGYSADELVELIRGMT
ncbi:GntR family transcriptional regulator [Streptomyces rubellomurinus]|uniref:GntR family transcriptional regulator n=1 Tax=Streptomyces rubellomurinus (strain ATCC 31215) TaxID=359131 RepID=A0A0F2TEC9_STRR3|nr:GntR family transcriptional regulator [Streptomyces rubellomurinus]KJS61528.1 GntR family transcriptional regulator [Streptomyces rubellomurinus]